MSDSNDPDLNGVCSYLMGLQDRICNALEQADGGERFHEERIEDDRGGLARPRALEGGEVIEKAAVHFTHSLGKELPSAATARRPELAGRGFEAASLSLIVHPRNPYAPTSHMNVRCFNAHKPGEEAAWWFGGGFDLTPYYPFEEDCIAWHRSARAACEPFGSDLYPRFKKACDDYFFLPHRGEARGIGGVFFDDFAEGDFAHCFGFMQSVGEGYLDGYIPILEQRSGTRYGDRERAFQLYRRGRYAEFNLIYDRGTRYGLQSGRRIESVLASLPPLAAWHYDWHPEPGSAEETLPEFLKPRDWA